MSGFVVSSRCGIHGFSTKSGRCIACDSPKGGRLRPPPAADALHDERGGHRVPDASASDRHFDALNEHVADGHLHPERLAPGVYAVGEELHLDVVELLEAAGYPDTSVNRESLTRAAHTVFGGLGIPVEDR